MSAIAALGVGYAREAAGPAIQQSLSSFRAAVGYNDLASGRAVTYEQNYLSTSPNAPGISVPAAQNDYHTTFRLSYAQALEVFNRRDWEHATAQERVTWWYELQLAARWNGIAMALPDGVPPNPAQGAVIGYDAFHYRTLALHSSTPAPLDSVIRAYYRSMVGDPFEAEKAEKELSFAWRRGRCGESKTVRTCCGRGITGARMTRSASAGSRHSTPTR